MYLWKLKRHRNRPSQKERKTSPKVSISIFLYWVTPFLYLTMCSRSGYTRGGEGRGGVTRPDQPMFTCSRILILRGRDGERSWTLYTNYSNFVTLQLKCRRGKLFQLSLPSLHFSPLLIKFSLLLSLVTWEYCIYSLSLIEIVRNSKATAFSLVRGWSATTIRAVARIISRVGWKFWVRQIYYEVDSNASCLSCLIILHPIFMFSKFKPSIQTAQHDIHTKMYLENKFYIFVNCLLFF